MLTVSKILRNTYISTPGLCRALHKLLTACGLGGAIDLRAAEEEAVQAAANASLVHFLQHAADVVRHNEYGRPALGVQMANIRGAMRLVKGIVVGFRDKSLALDQQLRVLRQFAQALDALGSTDLRGCHVLFGSSTQIDAAGNLWINAHDDPDDWVRFLEGVDLQFVQKRRELARDIRGLEASVASSLGVATIYTAAHSAASAEYREFLERLASEAFTQGPLSQGRLAKVPIFVAATSKHGRSPQQDTASEDFGPDFTVNESMGYLQVPMHAAGAQVISFARRHGPHAVAILQHEAEQSAAVQKLQEDARRRLRLRRLLKGDGVSTAQFRACCAFLLQHSATLADLSDGLSLQVEHQHGVEEDGSVVKIAWNCKM